MVEDTPLSIIIPSLGRKTELFQTLEMLYPMLLKEDELIIVDQNPIPLALPTELRHRALRHIHFRRPSLTRSRNLGIGLSKNNCMVFLDDDIVPRPGLLSELRQAHRCYPESIIAGAVEQAEKGDVQDVGFFNPETGEIRTDFNTIRRERLPFFPGGHVLIPKAALPHPPWYAPQLRGAAEGEEIDFALRCRRNGVEIVGWPKARILHLKAPMGGCRSPEYRRRFALDMVFNRAFIHARHGRLFAVGAFLKHNKGFIEFHSRRSGFPRHSPFWILQATGLIVQGWLRGVFSRPWR